MDFSSIKFDEKGLVPAIAQDAHDGTVLMLAYMNVESLQATIESGYATYWSRSRNELWQKGATSGHLQKIVGIRYDCDGDALLLTVEQTGPACHTGEKSCFFQTIVEGEDPATSAVLQDVYAVIQDRMAHPKGGSYTNYLLAKGVEKIAKKVGEEATETVIAAIQNDPDALCYEAGDLCYHLLVLLAERGIPLAKLWQELASRR